MAYVPQNHMVPVIPNLDDLPTTVRLPHPRRAPFVVLVVSAIWMMSSAFSPVWLPMLWPDLGLANQLFLTFVLTVAALGGGTIALRRYASEDEVIISGKGIDLCNFTWFGTKRKSFDWSEIEKIEQRTAVSDHVILELMVNDADEPVVPVFVARDEHEAARVRQRLKMLVGVE